MHRLAQCVLRGASLLSLASGLGCGSDTTGPTPLAPARLYFQLTLNYHAITLALTAPYNTLQLVATPQSAIGAPLADTGTTTYMVVTGNNNCGCQSVRVDPTGLLIADSVDANVEVIASRSIGGVTKTDSAFINVNDVNPVPVFTSLTLQPPPGDSAFFSTSEDGTVIPVALDADLGTISNVQFSVHATNAAVINPYRPLYYNPYFNNFDFGAVGAQPGKTYIIVSATVYGVTRKDSLLVTIGWSLTSFVNVFPVTPAGRLTPLGVFSPHDDTIAAGGVINWTNHLAGQSVDVVFDDPRKAQAVDSAVGSYYFIPGEGGGNIPAFAAVDSTGGSDMVGIRVRKFPTAGTYTYHSALYGTTGVIHVLPEFQVP